MSSLSNYENVLDMLNPVNLADYMIANFYGANQDWDHHNWYAARERVSGGKWHFFSWDAERTLESVNTNILGEDNSNNPSRLYARLRGSPEFRLLIADRLQKHFFTNGSLTPTRVRQFWDERAEAIEDAVVAESARWGDYRTSTPYTADSHWTPERTRLRNSYFPTRSGNVLGYFRSAGLFPSVGAPLFSQHGGPVNPGFNLTISRPGGTSGTILFALDGTDPREYGSGDIADGASTYSSPVPINGSVLVKARIRNGSTWSPLTEAFFSVPTLYDQLRVTELMYNAVAGNTREFVEIKNVGAGPVALAGLRFTAGIDYAFAADDILGPGDFYVIAADLDVFDASYPDVTPDGVYADSLSNSGERLTIRDRFDTRVLSVGFNDEDDWPLAPDGFGFSLVRDDIDGHPDHPSSWRASAAFHGSPGEDDDEPTHGGIVVNEVLSRTSAPFEDAIELHNPTGQAIDIGGWFLSDSRSDFTQLMKFRIPNGTVIPAGGFVVFYESDFNSNPGISPSFAIDGAGDQVYLSSADPNRDLTGHVVGMTFDAFDSEISFGRVITSVGSDTSPLVTRTFGADDPADVTEFRSGSGLPNGDPLVGPVVIHEIHYHPKAGGDEFIEIYNLTGETIDLYGTDSLGGDVDRGWRIRGISNSSGADSFEFPEGASLGPNGLALVVSTSPAAFRFRHGIADGVPIFGPFGGALANDGESVRLMRPAPPDAGEVPYNLVDRVVYGDTLPWPSEADGDGSSLERRVAADYGNDPENWGASNPVDGTPGLANSVGPPLPNQPPLATFTVQPSTGDAPLEVAVDASESEDPDGVIVNYDWDFGDDGRGSGREISHVYANVGKYTVRLTVRDNDGAQTSSSRTVTVREPPPNEAPVASFTATPTEGNAPLEVRFDASASDDPDGSIVSYSWNFDDGGAGTGRVLVHRFSNDGVYQVRLTVRDNQDAEDTATVTITVGSPPDNLPPVAEFSADPTQGDAPLQVRFDASESTDPDGSIANYSWDFDDGGAGAGRILLHRFDDAGEYDVRLTVTDNDDAQTSVTRRISVSMGNTGGGQRPGDCNQDGSVDISDGVCILSHLFLGDPAVLACDGGTVADPGNKALLNSNGDATVDLGDAIYLLTFLFQGGLPPVLGDECVRIPGCPDVCVP
jgi:PKD repeat protein